MSNRRLFTNSILSIAAKVVGAGIQIVCLPALLRVYGKSDYGLIAIALSLNTFVAIMQMGLPTSVPKFVAQWLGKGENANLQSAMRSVSSFYFGVAFLNFLVLLVIAIFWIDLFHILPEKVDTLRNLLIITAVTSLFAIPASVLDQALAGAQELGFASNLQVGSNLLTGALVAFTYLHPESLKLTQFYALRCALMFLPVPFSLMRWRRHGSLYVFVPGWELSAVRPLLKYSLSIFVFGIFIIISRRFVSIILAMRASKDAGAAMTEFQVIDGFNIFLSMIASSLMAALVPHLSAAIARGDDDILRRSIVQGTKAIWGLGALIGFGMIMLAGEGLCVYVGPGFLHLKGWLMLYLCTSLFYLYNTAYASAVLSSDKLSPLGWATGLGCIVSLVVTWFSVPIFGAGGAVLGIVGYVIAYFCVTHFWYFPKYFKLNPIKQIFQILLPPIVAGLAMCIAGRWLISYVGSVNNWLNIALGAFAGTLVYGAFILLFYISPGEFRSLIKKAR